MITWCGCWLMMIFVWPAAQSRSTESSLISPHPMNASAAPIAVFRKSCVVLSAFLSQQGRVAKGDLRSHPMISQFRETKALRGIPQGSVGRGKKEPYGERKSYFPKMFSVLLIPGLKWPCKNTSRISKVRSILSYCT